MAGGMAMVTLTKDMMPWGCNERIAVPGELADSLVREGSAKDKGPFPPEAEGVQSFARQTTQIADRVTKPGPVVHRVKGAQRG